MERLIAAPDGIFRCGFGMAKSCLNLSYILFKLLLESYLFLYLPGTTTKLFGVGESECSVIMLATYACASALLTLCCPFFIWLVL